MPSTISAGTTAGTAIAIAGDTTGNLAFQTNGTTTAMTIDTSQNVGIGTTSPGSKLQVAGTVTASSNITISDSTLNTPRALVLSANRNSSGALGTIRFGNTQFNNNEASIVAESDGAIDSARITFSTAPTGGSLTERMRITSSGQVGIGQNPTSYAQLQILFDATTAANNNLGIGISPVANTSNANFLQFYNATGNSCGNVTRNGTSNAVLYNTSSDYRLKENINPMTGALAKVKLLKPVTWTWIEGKQAGEGFIAHELQEVIPFAVTGQKDEMQTYVDSEGVEKTRPKYQGLDASYLVATLTAAIQEQQAQIEELKAEVAALKQGA